MGKVSGPLIDRIDIHVDVPAVPYKDLSSEAEGTGSFAMNREVMQARCRQTKRFVEGNDKILTNSRMNSRQVRKYCKLNEDCKILLKQAVYELGLSARAHDKVLKISRTIADIQGQDDIQSHHIAEAIQYRRLDRKL